MIFFYLNYKKFLGELIMKVSFKQILISIVVFSFLVVGFASESFAFKKRVIFGGGPAGGTFQVVANAIQIYKPVKQISTFSVKAQTSAGSIENLRKTNCGKQQMSSVYSGHVWLARQGKLKNDPNKYKQVLAVAWLYGAPAQLVVRADSGIKSAKDLVGKKVGVGNAGSGAFANCELFFSHLGIWDRVERNAMGYNDAAAAFGNNQLDAFWLFTAFPSGAVIMAAQTNDIALIDLKADADNSGFMREYKYFSDIEIPAGTYKGVNYTSPSFQDSTLWVAHSQVPASTVYELLLRLYTKAGLKHMVQQKKTFKHMSLETGSKNICTPFHPGAVQFWEEQGFKIDSSLKYNR
jgi:TRAP transporter TAXI family solute receptor